MNDKYKHKPQKKHTLSEVLKSLQDLIRTDLITAQQATPSPDAAPPEQTRAPGSSSQEADSFNQALDQLDEIITQKIIEPVERARSTAPEPLLPDEVIEIDWDEAFGGEAAAAGSRETSTPQAPPAAQTDSAPEEIIELQAIAIETIEPEPVIDIPPRAEAPTQPSTAPTEVSPVTDLASLPTVEIADAASEESKPPPAETPIARADESASAVASRQHELFETVALVPTEAPPADDSASATLESIEPEPMTSTTSPAKPEPTVPVETSDTAEIPTVVIEYSGGEPEGTTIELTAAEPPPEEPPAAKRPLSLVDEDTKREEPPRGAPSAPKPDSPSTPKKLLELAPDTPVSATEAKPAAPKKTASQRPPATTAKPKTSEPKAPVQEEIPVLKEIAPVDAPPSAPLPSASQARDIAIRVIAKLNIERRKAGEPPLDIKTIERLQSHLTDALSKREINKSK